MRGCGALRPPGCGTAAVGAPRARSGAGSGRCSAFPLARGTRHKVVRFPAGRDAPPRGCVQAGGGGGGGGRRAPGAPGTPGPRRAAGGARGAASGFPQGMTFRRAAIGCTAPSSPFMDTAAGKGQPPALLGPAPSAASPGARPAPPRLSAPPCARGGRARRRPRPSRGAGASERSRGQRSAGAVMVGAGRAGAFRGVPPGGGGCGVRAVPPSSRVPRPARDGTGGVRSSPSRGAGVCRVRVPPVP